MKQATFHTSKSQLITAIKKAAKELDLEIEENNTNEIVLFHGGGILSFGNRIRIKFTQSGYDKIKVSISSKSAVQVQIIDWGTNDNLENDLMTELKNML
jgi:isopentenyl phosphate kinase